MESIDIEIDAFLLPMVPYHAPSTGLEAKYSLEYGLATIVLDGRGGLHQYRDEAVRRPAARALMQQVTYHPVDEVRRPQSRVVVTLKDGEQLEETVNRSHGSPSDPLTDGEIEAKFHECAADLVTPPRRTRVLDLCRRLDSLADGRELVHELASNQEEVADGL